jgi:hypothetical protein
MREVSEPAKSMLVMSITGSDYYFVLLPWRDFHCQENFLSFGLFPKLQAEQTFFLIW